MTQQEFLRDAKERLALTWPAFARRIGAPEATLEKWIVAPESQDYREMPSTLWAFVKEILEHDTLKTGGDAATGNTQNKD